MDGEEPGQVTEFSYLGGLITEGGQCTNDKKQCWPGIIQIGQDVEDEQYISKHIHQTVQGICHSSTDVWIGVSVLANGCERKISRGNRLAKKSSGDNRMRQGS